MNLKAPAPILCKTCKKETAPEAIIGRLLTGDIFIQYTCPNCSPTKTVILERLPMNWVSIIHLVLYHLHAQDKTGAAYFRWKEDICRTIEDHWDDLCPARNPSGNWTNSISSILSANSNLFESGFGVMQQSGWWALKERDVPPTLGEAQKRGQVTVIDEQALQGEDSVLDVTSPRRKSPARQGQASPAKPIKPKTDTSLGKEDAVKEPVVSVASPSKRKLPVEPYTVPATVKPAMSAANLPTFSTTRTAIPPPTQPVPSAGNISPTGNGNGNGNNHPLRMLAAKPHGSGPDPTAAASEIKRKLVERLLRVDSELLKQALSKEKAGTSGPINPIMFIPSAQQQAKPKDSTTASTSVVPQPPKKKAKPAHYIRASPHENELVDLTNRVVNPDDQVLRLKRKLAVRKIKRMNGTQLFDLDNWIYLYLKAGNEPLSLLDASAPNLLEGLRKRHHATAQDSHVYGQHDALIQAELSDVPYLKDPKLSFWAKLMGVSNLEGYPFETESPYTGNMLPGFVHRETVKFPPRLLLLQQLRTHPADEQDVDSIDICNLRKEHVGQVNRLLRSNFWPSIDISESLEWPDYSFVLLYRKLVIGCAICNPEGYLSYIFVHPDWRRHNYASRLLYSVVRATGRRDVTVHVAVGNQAMMMYQRFGFKAEEYIVDFYGQRYKHVGDSVEPDPASRNAFFLRLRK